MQKTRFFLLLSLTAALAACDGIEGPPPKVANPDVVSLRLAEAADRAANALDNISKVEQARGPAVTPDDFSNAPPELQQVMTISWVGPIDKIMPTLAARAGYGFVGVGAPPPVPITVRLELYNAPLIKAVADIGTQAGKKADVTIDSAQKIMELRYVSNEANPVPPDDDSDAAPPMPSGLASQPHNLTPPPDAVPSKH